MGGPDGPYRQSERGDIYKDVAAKLLEAGYGERQFYLLRILDIGPSSNWPLNFSK